VHGPYPAASILDQRGGLRDVKNHDGVFFGAVIYVPNVVILGGFNEDDGARIFSVIVSVISTFPGVIYYVKRYGHRVK